MPKPRLSPPRRRGRRCSVGSRRSSRTWGTASGGVRSRRRTGEREGASGQAGQAGRAGCLPKGRDPSGRAVMTRKLFLFLAATTSAFAFGSGAPGLVSYAGNDDFSPSPLTDHAPASALAHDHRSQDEWFHGQRAFPDEQLAPGALVRARQSLERAPLARAVDANPWTSIGPSPIGSGGQADPTGPVSGRIAAIATHPSNSNVAYIGAASGGVWKTADGGASWTPLTDREDSLAVGGIAIDPTNANVIYAGTGENKFAGPPYYGTGVLKSSDGGSTWSLLGVTTFTACRVGRIVIDPTSPSTIYAASVGTYDSRLPENLPGSCLGGI